MGLDTGMDARYTVAWSALIAQCLSAALYVGLIDRFSASGARLSAVSGSLEGRLEVVGGSFEGRLSVV